MAVRRPTPTIWKTTALMGVYPSRSTIACRSDARSGVFSAVDAAFTVQGPGGQETGGAVNGLRVLRSVVAVNAGAFGSFCAAMERLASPADVAAAVNWTCAERMCEFGGIPRARKRRPTKVAFLVLSVPKSSV